MSKIDTNPALIDVRLTAIRYAARDTNLYELRNLDCSPLPSAEPGAHVDLHLPNGLVRHYSLTETGASLATYTVGIRRDPNSRGGSQYVFNELKVGQTFKISPPRNNFPLIEDASYTLLIAGGIGITPIIAMTRRLDALGREWELHYACRSRLDAAFLEELQPTVGSHLHFDEEAAGTFLDIGSIVAAAPAGVHVYCCGPLGMLRAFEAATAHLPPEQVHVEYFTAKDAPNLAGGFVVELKRSMREFIIPPGRSILKVLQDAGLEIAYSCEEGICGSCETAVVSGTPDHRDSVLTDGERRANKTMMICCSGSKSDRLVLDL